MCPCSKLQLLVALLVAWLALCCPALLLCPESPKAVVLIQHNHNALLHDRSAIAFVEEPLPDDNVSVTEAELGVVSRRSVQVVMCVMLGMVGLATVGWRMGMVGSMVDMCVALGLCVFYIIVSSGLISFNKYLMDPSRFPYPMVLASIHMTMTSMLSFLFYGVAPSWYPTMGAALENKLTVVKYVGLLATLYAGSLFMSNAAYLYANVAFLQFIKEANLTVVYTLSCIAGLQVFTFKKVAIIGWIIAGCSMCVTGEVHFVALGLVLQVAALLCECTKNVLLEVVLNGRDLKFDPLTLTVFQAPLTLLPLLAGVLITRPEGALIGLSECWHLILPNSMLAFVLNITLVVVIKRLSATTFVLTGLVKDMFIVVASVVTFGDEISKQQMIGFFVTIAGVSYWGYCKLMEGAAKSKQELEQKFAVPTNDLPAAPEAIK